MSSQTITIANPLAQTLTLPNGTILPNRLAKAAMSECLGDLNFAPTKKLTTLYRRFASGGAGLIITGHIMIDRRAVSEIGNIVVEDEQQLAGLQSWAAAAKSAGAIALAQINHPGRQVITGTGSHAVAPSPIGIHGTLGLFRAPRELTDYEIEQLIKRFANTAAIMVKAGFDGVEIHAAHGYLINQFLSPLTNQRSDKWGGDLVKRSRFLLEVVRAVRASVGSSAVVAVKLNSADFQRGGFESADAGQVIRWLNKEAVDLIEISGGTYESTAFMGVPAESMKASTKAREAYFLEFAELVREGLSVPLMLSGGFRTSAKMAEAINSGAIDLIGLARPLAMEPDLPSRLLSGSAKSSTVRPRQLGIKRIDGMADLIWHTTQLQRMGRGLDPAPDKHPLLTLAEYSWHFAPYTFARLTGGFK